MSDGGRHLAQCHTPVQVRHFHITLLRLRLGRKATPALEHERRDQKSEALVEMLKRGETIYGKERSRTGTASLAN